MNRLLTDDNRELAHVTLVTDTGATIVLTADEVYAALRRPVGAAPGRCQRCRAVRAVYGREAERVCGACLGEGTC